MNSNHVSAGQLIYSEKLMEYINKPIIYIRSVQDFIKTYIVDRGVINMRVDSGNGIHDIAGVQNSRRRDGYFSAVLSEKLQEGIEPKEKTDKFIHTDTLPYAAYPDYKHSNIDASNRNYERFRFSMGEDGSIMLNDSKTGKEIAVDPAQQESIHEAEEFLKEETGEESEIKSDIVVKPDGSRVLVMILKIGGMECTTSIEISKPTDLPNQNTSEKINEVNDTEEIHKMKSADEIQLDILSLQG